jgi:hypothetical protein
LPVRAARGVCQWRFDFLSLVLAPYSRNESFANDGHAAEDRRIGSAFPERLQFLPGVPPFLDEIDLRARKRGKTQPFALSGVGA